MSLLIVIYMFFIVSSRL